MVSQGRRYEIEMPLGKGGFGTVYRARFVGEGGFSKVVALKVLNENMADLEEVLARLRDEARLLGLLRHRAIVRADRLVRLANRWAVVMEYVEGADLKRIVSAAQVPVGAAVEIVGEVAGALHAAWNTEGPDGTPLRLIHRDIKPSNIVLTSYGEIKVLDFGIARADFGGREAETQAFGMGSLPYMAPERLDFRDTAAADVYALGVVFFELVTGRAFGRASANPERHTKHVDAALRFLVDQGLGNRDLLLFLGSLLAYDPDDRPTARQLERMCVNLRRRFEDEPLRYWAEQVVPGILANIALLPADTLTGSALVEQTEGTFAELPAALRRGAGSFARRAGQSDTSSGGTGSGAFSRPVGGLATGSIGTSSGSFSRPAADPAGSAGTGSGSLPPPPPPPITSGTFSRPQPDERSGAIVAPAATEPVATLDRPGEPGPVVTRPVETPEPVQHHASAPPNESRSRLLMAALMILLVLAVGVGVGVSIMKAQQAPPGPRDPAPPAAVEPPEPPAPVVEPLPVEAQPEPPPPEPAVEPPAPAPAPIAAAPTQAAPAAAKPAPEPEPKPEPAPAPVAAGSARVEVAGDAERVVLVGSAGSFVLPASVPDGSYTIRATFTGREPLVAGRVAVHAGDSLTVRCSAGFTRCKAQ